MSNNPGGASRMKLFIKSSTNKAAAGPAGGGASASSPAAPKDVRKRWLMVGAGIAVVGVMASNAFKADAPPALIAKEANNSVDVTPKVAEKRAFEAQYKEKLDAMSAQMNNVQAELARKDLEIKALQQDRTESKGPAAGVNVGALGGLTPEPPKPRVRDAQGNLIEAPGGGVMPPPVPALTPATPAGSAKAPPGPALGATEQPLPLKPLPANGGAPLRFAPKVEATPAAANGEVAARTSYKKNEKAGELPLSFAPMSLLNGIDAGASQATQSNPLPVLIRISDNATLPGAARYKLKSCFALGTGYGDLSSERVLVRISRLSCIDKDNRLALSQEVGGYVVDSDGTLGLRGRVDDRQGARLYKATLAGFAQGLAGALGSAQGTSAISGITGAVTSTLDGTEALRKAGLSGAQTATNQLAQFYLKEAANIFPVIVVENGRTGTVVFTSSTPLQWADADNGYVKQVTPTGR